LRRRLGNRQRRCESQGPASGQRGIVPLVHGLILALIFIAKVPCQTACLRARLRSEPRP
jgi:hypothetical protein